MSHTCRGTISLHGALIHTVDACTFVVSNGGTQTFHIKASTEVERQQWVTALELAKAKAIQAMESGSYDCACVSRKPVVVFATAWDFPTLLLHSFKSMCRRLMSALKKFDYFVAETGIPGGKINFWVVRMISVILSKNVHKNASCSKRFPR